MGKLANAQATLIARLTGDAFFTTAEDAAPGAKVPVISKTRGDIAAAINEAIANSSVGLVVLFIGAKRAEGTELVWECKWMISAIENPVAKADGVPTAEDIIEKVAVLLDRLPNGASPSDESDAGRFTVAPDAVDPLDASGDEKKPELAALNILVLTINTSITLN
jgi:hypothetical protein